MNDTPLEIIPTDDGLGYHVQLTVDGFTARCFVSSMHLCDEKRAQLLAAIQREAAAAFSIPTTPEPDGSF